MATVLGRRSGPQDRTEQARVPRGVRNRYKFLLQAHPHRWAWYPEDADAGHDGWLPLLGRIQLTPGCNGVGDGNVATLAMVRAAEGGWLVLLPSDPRLGKYRYYTQGFPGGGRNGVYASIWDSVRIVGNRAIWSFDDKGYREFLRFLVDSGIVPPIDSAVRDGLVADARSRLERMESRLATGAHNPSLATKVGALTERIDLMAAAEAVDDGGEVLQGEREADPDADEVSPPQVIRRKRSKATAATGATP